MQVEPPTNMSMMEKAKAKAKAVASAAADQASSTVVGDVDADPFGSLKEVFKKEVDDLKEIGQTVKAECIPGLIKFGMCDNLAQLINPAFVCSAMGALVADWVVASARMGLSDQGNAWPIELGCCTHLKDPQLALTCLLLPDCVMVHTMADIYGVPSNQMFCAFNLLELIIRAVIVPFSPFIWPIFLPCPCALAAPRTRMRRKYGIAGSVMDDCYVMTCCAPCAWMQMAYVASHYGEAPMLCKAGIVNSKPWGRRVAGDLKDNPNWSRHPSTGPVTSAPAKEEMTAL